MSLDPDIDARTQDIQKPPRVAFIGGSVRSGSTLLDRMLGVVPGVVSAGEIRFIWERWTTPGNTCGCGRPIRSCPFWCHVFDHAFGCLSDKDALEYARMQRRVDRWWRVAQLRSKKGSLDWRADLLAYLEALGKLFPAMCDVSGADIVVDSSKGASHGELLGLVRPGIDLRVIHLVRDPRAIAYSVTHRRRQDPGTGKELDHRGVFLTAVGWTVSNMLVAHLRRDSSAYGVLCYEDLVVSPRASLTAVLAFLNAGDRPLPLIGEDEIRFGVDHLVAGNPIRFQRGQLRIRPDTEWQRRLPASARALVSGLTWPVRGHLVSDPNRLEPVRGAS